MSLRLRKWGIAAAVVAVCLASAAAILLILSPAVPSGRVLPEHTPDPANGEVMYHAGDCIGCHRSGPRGGSGDPPSGGAAFPTPVGTFYPGNLTPDPETGIGRWTKAQFVDAMTEGVSPDGHHYFPAFPYTSFRNMRAEDLLDLHAYLMGLGPVSSPPREADVLLPALARRGVGVWKRLAFRAPTFQPDPTRDAAWNRGAYLVKGPGHCGECHTPRNVLMILDESRWLAGGPHPAGEGRVPSLLDLGGRGRYTDPADLVLAFQNGETLGYDKLSSGGMGDVQMNLALLPEDDLRAIAGYLFSLR